MTQNKEAKTPPVKRKFDAQRDKVKKGKTWTYPLEMENDVAQAVLKDIDKNPDGVVLNRLLNNKLRQAYKLKRK